MYSSNFSDLDDFFIYWDPASIPAVNDKLKECEFFFALLSVETDRNKFRWLTSAFMNAAYSFFESSALTAHFRTFDPETGEAHGDLYGLQILARHVKVTQRKNDPYFVKTAGLTPITAALYDFRKKNTHHYALPIMETGPSLPEDFHFGTRRGEGTPVMVLCRDALTVIRLISADLGE